MGLNLEDLGEKVGKRGALLKNGDKFGKLTIIDANCIRISGEISSLCQCECGEQKYVRNDFLKRNHTTSCGCKNGHNKANCINDGDIFGELTVLKANVGLNKHGDQISLCHCSCGKELTIINNYLRRGQYSCGHVQSRGEQKIQKILSENNILNQSQYTFSDLVGTTRPLRFDFAIFKQDGEIKCLIEYQGQQHYKAFDIFGGEKKFQLQQEYDNLKREYCIKNNIRLIEISYLDYDKIDYEYLWKCINSE